jgi:hypothetical protein
MLHGAPKVSDSLNVKLASTDVAIMLQEEASLC